MMTKVMERFSMTELKIIMVNLNRLNKTINTLLPLFF